MNIWLTIKLAIKGLLINKIRAFLTILGIIIGVGAIIVIVAVGNGAESLIVNQISSIGTNLIGILPGGQEEGEPPAAAFGIVVTTLKSDDIYALKDIPHVIAVSGYNNTVDQVWYENRKTQSQIYGVSPDYPIVEDGIIEEGRFFTDAEDRSLAKVVVLGNEIKNTLFGDISPVGERIKIKNNTYKIIGYFKERGATGFSNKDSHIYIPLNTMQQLVPPKPNALQSAISIGCSRASLGITSTMSKFGSGMWLMVGRSIPRCIPSIVRAASMAAAAPRVWPNWDLFEETGISFRPLPGRGLGARTGDEVDR